MEWLTVDRFSLIDMALCTFVALVVTDLSKWLRNRS